MYNWIMIGGVILGCIIVYGLTIFLVKRRLISQSSFLKKDVSPLVKRLMLPLILVLSGFVVRILPSLIPLKESIEEVYMGFSSFWLIFSIAFFVIRIVNTIKEIIGTRFDIEVKDNLEARKIHTQLRVIERILTVLILVIAFSSFLMTFDTIRQLGTSLLASAGVVGIILGFAAQKSIATIFAGLQIALTQPIRIDDVVIVEGEWGWIEEISLTYVVVKIWDQRRLIVPITYFIEKPFQNWTRTTAELLGSVFIYTDYTVPVEPLRNELQNILESTPLWDKRVCVLQVTNATETTVELRALMSAATSPKAWDLRCLVREKLITFLQENYPQHLPRTRVELEQKLSEQND